MAEHLRHGNASPLLALVGFDISRVFWDALHTLELGIYQVVLPSILAELTASGSTVFPGATLPLRLQRATQAYHAWARRNRVLARVKRMTPAWVQLPYPRISRPLNSYMPPAGGKGGASARGSEPRRRGRGGWRGSGGGRGEGGKGEGEGEGTAEGEGEDGGGRGRGRRDRELGGRWDLPASAQVSITPRARPRGRCWDFSRRRARKTPAARTGESGCE
jgi:uncharacterized membrane protein YgcG